MREWVQSVLLQARKLLLSRQGAAITSLQRLPSPHACHVPAHRQPQHLVEQQVLPGAAHLLLALLSCRLAPARQLHPSQFLIVCCPWPLCLASWQSTRWHKSRSQTNKACCGMLSICIPEEEAAPNGSETTRQNAVNILYIIYSITTLQAVELLT